MKNCAVIILSLNLLAAPVVDATILIAHRGASYDAPENTLTSLKLGYQQGAEAGECDIQLTRDGKIMLMHDYDTARTGGISNRIAAAHSETLRRMAIGKWGQWKDRPTADTIPSLDEALAVIPEGKRLFIEIKCGVEILPELERALRQSGMQPSQTPIIGFGYDTVKATKARMPALEVSWLVSSDKKTKEFPPVDELIAKATAAKLDGLDLNFGFPIDAEFVRKVHAAGLKLYVWTVDDPEIARRQAAAGVDGITTNRPEWLRREASISPVGSREGRAAKP